MVGGGGSPLVWVVGEFSLCEGYDWREDWEGRSDGRVGWMVCFEPFDVSMRSGLCCHHWNY